MRRCCIIADRSRNVVQSVERALDIIEALEQGPAEIGVSELGRRLGLHKSTIFGLLNTLSKRGYLEKNQETGKYRLGLRAFEVGSTVLNRMDLPALAGPILQNLVNDHQETVHLVIRDGFEVVYVAKRESARSVRIVSQVGRRLPCYCTGVGKALLAYIPEEDIEAFFRKTGFRKFTKNTIADLETLKAELERIRVEGYAIDNEEIEEGLKCVAAPVRDHTGKVVAALSVAGPASRMTGEKIAQLVSCVKAASAELSHRLGYRQ
ncbi:MAG: IclR family transcriptional regulator [Ignavibacteriales bacterium]